MTVEFIESIDKLILETGKSKYTGIQIPYEKNTLNLDWMKNNKFTFSLQKNSANEWTFLVYFPIEYKCMLLNKPPIGVCEWCERPMWEKTLVPFWNCLTGTQDSKWEFTCERCNSKLCKAC